MTPSAEQVVYRNTSPTVCSTSKHKLSQDAEELKRRYAEFYNSGSKDNDDDSAPCIITNQALNDSELVCAARDGLEGAVLSLLHHETSSPRINGGLPLLEACENGHVGVVEILLQHWPGPHPFKDDALVVTVASMSSAMATRTRIVRMLLQSGADACARHHQALVYAVLNCDVDSVSILEEYGADLHHASHVEGVGEKLCFNDLRLSSDSLLVLAAASKKSNRKERKDMIAYLLSRNITLLLDEAVFAAIGNRNFETADQLVSFYTSHRERLLFPQLEHRAEFLMLASARGRELGKSCQDRLHWLTQYIGIQLELRDDVWRNVNSAVKIAFLQENKYAFEFFLEFAPPEDRQNLLFHVLPNGSNLVDEGMIRLVFHHCETYCEKRRLFCMTSRWVTHLSKFHSIFLDIFGNAFVQWLLSFGRNEYSVWTTWDFWEAVFSLLKFEDLCTFLEMPDRNYIVCRKYFLEWLQRSGIVLPYHIYQGMFEAACQQKNGKSAHLIWKRKHISTRDAFYIAAKHKCRLLVLDMLAEKEGRDVWSELFCQKPSESLLLAVKNGLDEHVLACLEEYKYPKKETLDAFFVALRSGYSRVVDIFLTRERECLSESDIMYIENKLFWTHGLDMYHVLCRHGIHPVGYGESRLVRDNRPLKPDAEMSRSLRSFLDSFDSETLREAELIIDMLMDNVCNTDTEFFVNILFDVMRKYLHLGKNVFSRDKLRFARRIVLGRIAWKMMNRLGCFFQVYGTLLEASGHGRVALVKALLNSHGRVFSSTSNAILHAICLAKEYGHVDIFELLLSYYGCLSTHPAHVLSLDNVHVLHTNVLNAIMRLDRTKSTADSLHLGNVCGNVCEESAVKEFLCSEHWRRNLSNVYIFKYWRLADVAQSQGANWDADWVLRNRGKLFGYLVNEDAQYAFARFLDLNWSEEMVVCLLKILRDWFRHNIPQSQTLLLGIFFSVCASRWYWDAVGIFQKEASFFELLDLVVEHLVACLPVLRVMMKFVDMKTMLGSKELSGQMAYMLFEDWNAVQETICHVAPESPELILIVLKSIVQREIHADWFFWKTRAE